MQFVNNMEELECTEAGSLRSREVMVVCPLEVSNGVMESYGKNVTVLATDAGAFYRKSSGTTQEFVETSRNSIGASTEFYTAWRTFDARTARVASLVENSGGVATLSQIGTSVEGRPIMVVRMRGAGWAAGDPRVVVDCELHAREWITGMSCVYVLEKAIEKARADSSWLAGMEFAMIPMANPDGVIYSETTNRMWRKNRADNNGNSCKGVDLNRNWGPDWAGPYSVSGSKCSDVYYGSSAYSEPETQAVKSLIDEAPVFIHLDIHSYGAMILAPWSSTYNPHPERAQLDVPGKLMQSAIAAVNGLTYLYGGNEVLYPASGVCPDYSTSTGAWGWTYELRPSSGGGGFAPLASQILPSAEELYQGILAAISFTQGYEPPAPTPAPPPGTWTLSGTGCVMDGDCISSLNYPSNYGNNEQCTVTLSGDIAISVDAFSTEAGYDLLTMGGNTYSGTSGPASGTYSGSIAWASDYSVTRSGWKMCKAWSV